jgi:hypothetical protein
MFLSANYQGEGKPATSGVRKKSTKGKAADQNWDQPFRTVRIRRKLPVNPIKLIGEKGIINEFSQDLMTPWVRDVSRLSTVNNLNSYFIQSFVRTNYADSTKKFKKLDLYWNCIAQKGNYDEHLDREIVNLKTAECLTVGLECLGQYKKFFPKDSISWNLSHSSFFDIICEEFEIKTAENIHRFANLVKNYYD